MKHLFNRFSAAIRTQRNDADRGILRFFGVSNAGVRVTHDSAMQVAAVWACIDVIASALASSDWNVYGGARNVANKQDLPEDNLQYILNTRWNPEATAQSAKRAMMIAAVGYGNGIAEIERDLAGRIVGLWPILPDRVEVRRDERTNELIYRVNHSDQGTFVDLTPDEVFHIRGPGLTGFMGDDTLNRAVKSISQAVAMDAFTSAYFGNSAQLGTVLMYKNAKLDDEHYDRLKSSMETRHKGAGKAFTTAILDGGEWDVKQIGTDADKAQIIEAKHLSVEEVCRWFHVPPHKVAHLLRCMPGETLVFTEVGPKRIDSILPGEKVWSPTPAGPKLCKVVNHWDNGVREVLQISSTNRTVRCTANHRLLVRREHHRNLNPGEIGGKNVDGKKVRVFWKDEYIAAGDLRVGDTMITLAGLPDSGVNTAPNGRQITPGFMAFCGLLLSDGNIQYNEKGLPAGVGIARCDHASYMNAYREIAVNEFIKYASSGVVNAESLTAPVVMCEHTRSTTFRSVLAAKELSDLGFSGTAYTKRVPGWIYGCSHELQLAFLRGFLDGDGTLDAKGRLTYYSANKALLDDIRHLCMSVGVPVTNSRSDVNGPKSFGKVKTRMWRFTCSDPGANSRIGSYDTRYIARLKGAKKFGRKDRAYPRFGGKFSSVPGTAIARISKIEVLPAVPVFDIEVEGSHCFFADGVGSHNSSNNNIEHQGLEFTRDTLRPWAKEIEQESDFKLIPYRGPRKFVEIDMDWAEQGDYKSRLEAYQIGRSMGVFSANDILRKLGENTIGSDGDIRIVQGAMIRLEDVGMAYKAPAAGAAPAAEPEDDPEEPEDDPEDEPDETMQAWLESVYEQIVRRRDNRELNLETAKKPDAKAQAQVDAKKYGAEVVGRMNRVLSAQQLESAQEWAIHVVDGCEPRIAARAALKGK